MNKLDKSSHPVMTLLIEVILIYTYIYIYIIILFFFFFFYIINKSLHQLRFKRLGGLPGILFDERALIRGLE
jgi:hypothetical protein